MSNDRENEIVNKASLRGRQVFFLVYLSLVGGMLFSAITVSVKWFDLYYSVAFVIQGIICTLFCLICGYNSNASKDYLKFRSKNGEQVKVSFYDKTAFVCGKKVAVCICIGILILVLFYLGNMLNSTSLLIKEAILPRTSVYFIAVIIILSGVFSADKGIRNVARVCEVFGVVVMLLLVFTIITMITNIDVYNLLPMNMQGMISTVKGNFLDKNILPNISFVFPVIVVLVISGVREKDTDKGNNKKPKTISKSAVVAVWASVVTMIILATCVVGVMGVSQTKSYGDSILVAIKQTSIPLITFLQRLDIVVISAMVLGIFCAVSALVCVCHELLNQSTKLGNGAINTIIVVALIALVVVFQLDMLYSYLTNVLVFAVTTIAFIVAIIISITAKVKGNGSGRRKV